MNPIASSLRAGICSLSFCILSTLHSLIPLTTVSSSKYLLSTAYVLGTILGPDDIAVSKTENLCSYRANIVEGG